MKRATGVLLLLAVSVTLVSCGSPQDTTRGRDDHPENTVPGEIRLIEELTGVSPTEASAILALQGELAEIRAELLETKAETFGGLWMEYDPIRAVVAFTRDAEREIELLRERVSMPEMLVAVEVRYTLRELEAVESQLWSAARSPINGWEALYGRSFSARRDETRNQIELVTTDPVVVATARSLIPADMLHVVSDTPPTTVLD